MNKTLAIAHFCKGRKLIPTLQFRRNLAHELLGDTIGVNTVASGRPRKSTCTLAIVTFKLQKVKKHEGSYEKKAKT